MSRRDRVSVEKPTRMADGQWRCRFRWYDADGQRKSRLAYGPSAQQARTRAQVEGQAEVLEATAPAAPAAEAILTPLPAHYGPPPAPPKPTFAEVADEARRSTIPARQKPRQVRTTKAYLDRWWLPALGDRPIDQITPAELNAVIADAKAHVAPATCNRILAAAAVVFRHAEAAYLIDRLPTTRAIKLKEGRKIPTIFSARELAAVLWAIDAEWRLFVALMALAGLRKTEAMELRAGDVAREHGVLTVRGGDGGTKSGHERLVPIISSLLDDLLREALVGRMPDDRLVTQTDPRKALRRAGDAIGVSKRVSPHRLRHGFASLVHAGGIQTTGAPIRTVQAWLGHSNLSVTERYTHLARPSAAADLLFDQLGSALGWR